MRLADQWPRGARCCHGGRPEVLGSACGGGVDALHGVGGGQGRVAAGEVGWVLEGPARGLDDVLLSGDKGWGGACQRGHDCSNLRHRLLQRPHPRLGLR